ncbi:MAG: dephospho-CoA kinase [Syntrophales bacterium]|nr:dephospho-CoA kinase [Syntrophales bacterium]
MLNVGLTGGIASGKSAVADMFVQKGAFHLDFDRIAHEVAEPYSEVWYTIVNNFGTEILREDKSINRGKLGEIVFGDWDKLKLLNTIVHPAVINIWEKRLKAIQVEHPTAIVISNVPLLFEINMQSYFDVVIVVYASPEEQIRRLMSRNGYTLEQARARLNSQLPIYEKIKRADIVIDNNGSIEETKETVNTVWQHLLALEEKKRHGKNPVPKNIITTRRYSR